MRFASISLLAVYKNCRSFVLRAIAALLLSACTPILNGPGALALPDKQIAILEDRWSCRYSVVGIYKDKNGAAVYEEGKDNRADRFRLIPGRYVIAYRYRGIKVPQVSRHDSVVELKSGLYSVELKSGHIYQVNCNQSPIWIEDLSTGEVMAGEKW